ncbi:MAG: hypothetical protein C0490_06655 [Marivirga sp.]|nr:hypothetical protein [Marivirga sp.]
MGMKSNTARVPILITGIFFLIITFSGCKKNKTYSVKTETIAVNSLSQIVPLSDILVEPFLYTNISGLEKLPVPESKAKFISAVLPAILVAKHEIEMVKIKIEKLNGDADWTGEDSLLFLDQKLRYKARDLEDLLKRIGSLPNSIVLAQAAVESGWGQSRFFRQGNNLFGVWSFNAHESRIAAGRTRQNKTIYLRSYKNMSESIVHYFEILGSAGAYKGLRKARLEKNDSFELLPYLKNFSERRTSYINQLRAVILQNELTQYDQYALDPEYLIED